MYKGTGLFGMHTYHPPFLHWCTGSPTLNINKLNQIPHAETPLQSKVVQKKHSLRHRYAFLILLHGRLLILQGDIAPDDLLWGLVREFEIVFYVCVLFDLEDDDGGCD